MYVGNNTVKISIRSQKNFTLSNEIFNDFAVSLIQLIESIPSFFILRVLYCIYIIDQAAKTKRFSQCPSIRPQNISTLKVTI